MNNPLVNQAAMVLPVFLLSACLGGGGSFDLDSVDTEAPRAAPKYQDVPSKKPEARKDQGGYGFAMRFKRRNWYRMANENEVKLNESDWEQTDNGNIKEPSKQKSIIDALTGNDGETLQDSSQQEGISKVTGYHDFKYVWSGFFYKQIRNTIEKDSSSKITAVRSGPDGQTGMATNGVQTVSNTAGGTSGKTKTHYEVQACCSNLNYLKYGLLTRKNSSQADAKMGQVEQSMFLQGERTDEKEIPQEQNVVYSGTWYGHIATNGTSWAREASDQENGNRANFDVNFKDKRITGTLTAENRSEATFTIEAMIEGNGFKGTAKTGNGGFAPDQNSSTGTHKVHITNAAVQGGFYGPNAEELGGWFAYPGNGQTKNAQTSSGNGNSAGSATVVFGAKRQQLVK
ncbi:transferrin-binding protein-like solute binding protein [Neisseria gonorrhoeae]